MVKTTLILVSLFFVTVHPYNWRMFSDEHMNLCNDQTCNGRPHSACLPLEPDNSCKNFEMIEINPHVKRLLLNGHNGIRNRIAKNRKNPASNMQYLVTQFYLFLIIFMNIVFPQHWDNDLQRMAEGWIVQCKLKVDDCQFLYNASYPVGQNIDFVSGLLKSPWPIEIIRNWFLESNSQELQAANEIVLQKESNFTQLVWADTEFVGCAAAKVFAGHFMVCNYYPKGNIISMPVFLPGKPCSNCPSERVSCSRIFHGLCGLDDPSGAFKLHRFNIMITIGSVTLQMLWYL